MKKSVLRSEGGRTCRQSKGGPRSWRWLTTGMLSLTLAVFGTLSCEQAITIKGMITIPVAVQQEFSSADRGRVVIWAEDAASTSPIGGRTIYILCDPGSVDLTAPFSLTKFACGNEASVQAMVFPLNGPHAEVFAALPCGPVSAPPAGTVSADAIAYGRQLVFEGRKGGCEGGTAVANITVQLTK